MMTAPPPRLSGSRLGHRGTRTRLIATFASILVLFGLSLLLVLLAMGRMETAEREDAELDHAKHTGHRVAALVREQYIHQAHTIIAWNRSHLGHYREIASVTASAADDLVALTRTEEDRQTAGEIAALIESNDRDFMDVTLPALDRNEHGEVLRLHAATEGVIVDVTNRLSGLNERFERRSDAARTRATRERSRVRWIAITCFGAALGLAALFGVLTTKSISRRVFALREGARSVGDGKLETRIRIEGDDELSDVAAAMNEMARSLASHQAELIRSQKLASIGRLCAGVAHEINGPIGIILGYARVIRKEGPDEEALSAIEDEARQCQRIIQALLDMSRQELPPAVEVDVAQLAREGTERLRTAGMLGGRGVTVVAGRSVLAYGDEAKLRQVVLNVLTNAVEATSAGGTIEVAVVEEDGRVNLSVKDDGCGLTASAREHLFEPFYTTKVQGTGLGLAISRAIVEAHRGELTIESGGEGGTRVAISLETPPRKDAAA